MAKNPGTPRYYRAQNPLSPLRIALTGCAIAGCALALAACQSAPTTPLETVPHVDLKRFMGDWYVIANIPPFIEKDAHNSIENYQLDPDGTVAITFTYLDGEAGKPKVLKSRGFVLDPKTNATWGVQFIWPIKADYRITYLAPDYSQTIVSREKRDWVWIMARTPTIPAADYERLVALVGEQGYDVPKLRRVSQQWK